MNILITGYNGFIGQNLVSTFTEHNLTLFEWGETFPNLDNIDWVIHLGAVTSTTEQNINKILQQNLDFSVWLFEQCGKYKINLQYASSASIYGNSKTFNENDLPNPQSPYAWSKYLFERYVQKNLSKFQIVVQGFRYFNVYGKYEDHKGNQASPYHKFLNQAINTGEIILFENSDQYYRDFVPVEDVINVHKKFLNIKESGIWNVGTGKPTSFQSIADHIADKTGAKIKFIPMPENLRAQYQPYTCADLTKLLSTLYEKSNY